ncbi:MAG: ABC transporter permease [Theionarchaea archaeon]|nr:ABC transporter permease [Theionarchaea archaeon]
MVVLTKGLETEFTKMVSNRTLILFVMMPLVIAIVLPYALARDQVIFGMLAFFNVFMISIMDTLVSLVEEREHKTMEAMMITPLGLDTVLLSKLIVSSVLVLINAVLIVVVIPWIFNISLDTGSAVLIIVLSVPLAFLFSGLAVVIAAYVNNMKEAEQTGTAVATILLFTGFIPLERMPHWLQEIVKITPLTNGNYLFTQIILNPTGKGLASLGINLGITLVFCVGIVYAGLRIFRHRIYA